MTAISKQKTNQSTEVKDEKKKTIEDIRKHLNKYKYIKYSKDFTYRQKDILSLMLFRGNGQDEGFTMGYKHIMDIFGYSSTAISAAISLFKDYNFISVEKGHTGTNSKYTLNYDTMKNYKSSSTVSVSDSEIREAKSEKRSKIREEKTYDTVIQALTRLLSDLQIREEKRRETEKRYIADIQALTRLLSDKFDTVIDLINQRLNININNNINKNLKDNISNNNNTEGNNIKDQEKKKNISTGNLEKLKENSNDEIIQRENEIENTSKDKLLVNENFNNENNIQSDEKDNSKVESSKENEDLNENSKDEISTDENSKDNEILEYSIFGDEIPQDNENQNTVKFIDGKFQVVEQVKDKINLNLSEMKNSKKKSQTIENVKTVKGEISNGLNSSKENENFNVFGKLQSYRDLNSGRVEGYQFNVYDNLTAAKDYSKSFHASVLCLNLESSDLKKVSVSDTGVWGILNRTNGEYSFTQSNVNTHYSEKVTQSCAAETAETSNNVPQGDEIAEVDNHTTEGEKIDSTQSQIANKASDDNNDTTADNKNDENTVESPSEDTPKTEIPSDGNETPNNALQGDKTSKVDSNTTNTEKVAPVQPQAVNNDILSHHGNYNTKPSKGAWRQMTIHLHGEQTTVSEALNNFKDKKKDGKEYMECNTFFYYYNPICLEIDRLIKEGKMTEEQKNDCITIFGKLTKGKFAYWHKVFTTRPPRPNFPSEEEMWKLLGCPQVTNKNNDKTVDNNKVYEDNVILPSEKDFKDMELDEIKNTLLNFVQEHPNISDDKNAYINNLCIAYTLEPQNVA